MSAIGPISAAIDANLIIGPHDPRGYTALITAVANQSDFAAFTVRRHVVVTSAVLHVGVQSGNIDIGIYQRTSAGPWMDATKIASTGTIACPGAGVAVVSLGASVALVPGVVYLAAMSVDNATAQFVRQQAYSTQVSSYMGLDVLKAVFPLPASLVGETAPASRSWVIVFR